jgi:hypothetical protein
MAYKSIMGRDTGMSMSVGITSGGLTRFPVAAGCSAVGIGRPSVCIGRAISGDRVQFVGLKASLKESVGERRKRSALDQPQHDGNDDTADYCRLVVFNRKAICVVSQINSATQTTLGHR